MFFRRREFPEKCLAFLGLAPAVVKRPTVLTAQEPAPEVPPNFTEGTRHRFCVNGHVFEATVLWAEIEQDFHFHNTQIRDGRRDNTMVRKEVKLMVQLDPDTLVVRNFLSPGAGATEPDGRHQCR